MDGRPEWFPDWVPDWVIIPGWALDTWDEIVRVWNLGVFGITYGRIFEAIAILLVALLLRGFVARTIVRGITRAASGTKSKLDDALVKAIAEPLKLLPMIVGIYAAMQVLEVTPQWSEITGKVLQSLMAVAVFWTLSRAVGAFSFLLGAYKATLGWLIRTLEIVFAALGVAAVLQLWNVPILPVLGGLGIFGVALAFGAQDLVKNVISGIFILVEKRFQPGDRIMVDGTVEGTVESISFRSITVRQPDKTPVYVPNAIFSDVAVKNFSRTTHRQIKWTIGLEYRSTVEQLKHVRDEIDAFLWTTEEFAKPPAAGISVHIDALNESSIDIQVNCFTVATDVDSWRLAKEKLAVRVIEIVRAAGTDFAFPSRTLYTQQVNAPEPFPLPAPSQGVAEAKRLRAAIPRPAPVEDEEDE
jgi:MscS family membrane protein